MTGRGRVDHDTSRHVGGCTGLAQQVLHALHVGRIPMVNTVMGACRSVTGLRLVVKLGLLLLKDRCLLNHIRHGDVHHLLDGHLHGLDCDWGHVPPILLGELLTLVKRGRLGIGVRHGVFVAALLMYLFEHVGQLLLLEISNSFLALG